MLKAAESLPALTRTRARIMLLVCLLTGVVGTVSELYEMSGPSGQAPTARADGDVALFVAVVARVRAGEPYHDALADEMRTRRYPTASVFNWRTPLLYSVLGALPPRVGRVLLAGLGVTLLAFTLITLARRPLLPLMVALLLQIGAVVTIAVSQAPLLSEGWAGVLIGLSVCAYYRRAWQTAALLGLLALFVRELAAPYAVVCALLALRGRRWNELALWGLGAVVYAGYFGGHLQYVLALQQPGDLAHQHSWLYGGGTGFVVATLRANACILVSPPGVASVLLALLVAGSLWSGAAAHLRWTVPAYLLLLLVVGQPFNYYWGLTTAPLFALITADGVEALQGWWVAAVRPPISLA